MKDERSKKAVEVAEQFGLGNATRDELNTAYAAAYNAAYTAADRKKNQMETAKICIDILGNLIIEKVNNLLKT